ncbi:MAG TPA: protein-glutamate O-methyltransferase CheR [Gammaproteobacteria bacterium]|nr:protein-glutamate O-methyltransferase CheR [Gammaproteobacteria bacterium]
MTGNAIPAQSLSSEDYNAFRSFLEEASGIVLGDNKHYLVTSRLARLMKEQGIESFGVLMQHIKRDGKLRHRIMDAMTTNETSWFRDNYPFDILKEQLLPEFARKQARQVRIWSAASSTGQEAYSLSMIVSEYLQKRPGSLPANGVQILGTDISPTVLEQARSGIYEGVAASRGLSEERKRRFFIQTGAGWQVKDEIRKRVSFRELNLMQSYTALGKFDVIYCRNVLIYFSAELKRDILARMARTLNPGGFLVLGGSESISSYSEDFELVRWRNGVIYRLA